MDIEKTIELTLEQEFSLRNFAGLVQQMSREQAQNFLIEQHKLMMLWETMYQKLLRHEWKLDVNFASLQK